MIDLRDVLPIADWQNGTAPKSSATVHWPAAKEPITDPLAALMGYAEFHLSNDWNDDVPGVQASDGIQYSRAFDQEGNTYVTREREAVLWHAGNDHANRTSIPYLALVAIGERPSPKMLRAINRQMTVDGVQTLYPHANWSATACPGHDLQVWAASGRPEEEEVDLAELERRIDARIAEYGKRLQPELEHDRERISNVEAFARDHRHRLQVGPGTLVHTERAVLVPDPPEPGATLIGSSQDSSIVFWLLPNGQTHTYVNGVRVS